VVVLSIFLFIIFQLDKCTRTLDCGKFLDSMILVVSRTWENSPFYQIIDHLRQFIERIEKAAY